MDWLNYHHLLYFWVVAREGSIARACESLHLSQPTISNQLRKLERAVGGKVFERAGRGLSLTETGRLLFRYAEEIFSLGRELQDAVRGRPTGQPLRFAVGVADVLPKLIVFRLLRPAFQLSDTIHTVCSEGSFEELLERLAGHELDLVLSDSPIPSGTRVRAYNHLLGSCGVAFFGTKSLARRLRKDFPSSLDNAPLLLPTRANTLRRALDQFFDENNLRPRVIGEFQDSALLKVFGQEGLGVFPAPEAIRNEVERQYDVEYVGTIDKIRETFFAISAERRLKHPAVVAISDIARKQLFLGDDTG